MPRAARSGRGSADLEACSSRIDRSPRAALAWRRAHAAPRASEAIREAAGSEFAFRLLDLVAVKGKTRGARVYELIGRAGEHPAREQAGRVYELAFEAYMERRFETALRIAEAQPDDPPSRVLEERCRAFLTEPPPPEWDGTYISRTK